MTRASIPDDETVKAVEAALPGWRVVPAEPRPISSPHEVVQGVDIETLRRKFARPPEVTPQTELVVLERTGEGPGPRRTVALVRNGKVVGRQG